MYWWLPLCTLSLWIAALSATEDRRIHRLVGGHIRVFHEDTNDAELLETLASGSKSKKSQKGDEEEKKTLSQQVADGKYGLIQKELFKKGSKRPGVLSYDSNPEVPKDNINNLGGLTKNEIWLAENHLLVLKGGTYPPHEDNKNENSASIWPPIDDYKAPLRQVKIPAHPKVPPPFPVQLTDDGPLQILGTNSSRTINGTLEETAFAVPPPEGFDPSPYFPPSFYTHPANATSGKTPLPSAVHPSGEYLPGSPFPPHNLNGTLPPFFASLPPGAAILPPPDLDEDDPSIYYPPPYSFYYPKDNSSAVEPGPLVPGIILPPPPNFFAPLQETRKPTRQRSKSTTTPLPQIHPTTIAAPPTSGIGERKPIRILPAEINNGLKSIVTTTPPKVVTVLSQVRKNPTPKVQRTRPPTVTILKPVTYNNVYKPQQTTTQVPLKIYYTTSNEIETNSITRAPEKFHIGIANANAKRVKTTTKSPAQYYYYEPNEVTTRKPYYDIPKEYYIPPKQTNPVEQPKYVYVQSRPYNTQRPRIRFVQTPKTDTFSVHIARLQKQIHQYYTTSRPTYSPKPVYQFSFEASNYHRPQQRPQYDQEDKFRPLPKYSVQIQPAIDLSPTETPPNYVTTTQRPKYYAPTPRPVSHFEFDATQNPKGFYTQPEEFFDENTRHYFTTFGQKIQPQTTPIPQAAQSVTVTRQRKPNLEGDIAVNYLPPKPGVNPDAEFVPVNQNYRQKSRNQRPKADNQGGGSFISYQLPGDEGAHFYFLTPQLAQSREQGAGYYYSRPNGPRLRRNQR